MNGEVGLAARLTVAARKAIKTGNTEFQALPHESSITFMFSRRVTAIGTVPEFVAKSPKEWFNKLIEDSATDVFMMLPYAVKDKSKLGFINTSCVTIFVRYKNEGVTRFVSEWIYDKDTKKWAVIFHEDPMNDAPSELPTFKDNSAQFAAVLDNMAKFAHHIGFDMFAGLFQTGAGVLAGAPLPETLNLSAAPDLPEDKLRIYLAADISDVFGGMGSWNDSPPYKAHEMGLSDDYDKLSAALYAQNRLALMYAVNED